MGKPLDKEKERYWRGVFQSQQQSGVSVAAFCGTRRIALHQFYWWRRRLQRSQGSRKSETQKPTTFIPVRLPSMTEPMEIVHPNGCIVRLKSHVDTVSLQQVLQALNSLTVRKA